MLKIFSCLWRFIGAVCFSITVIAATIIFSLPSPILFFASHKLRYKVITMWCRTGVAAAKLFCGINYKTEGLENLPTESCVILSKHQSMWDTMFFPTFLPQQSWVLKKELLYVPVFGWSLSLLQPIAIRRSAHNVVKSIIKQGKQRLEQGLWVIIFPEGTRVKPGEKGYYSKSGAAIALAANKAVIPVALNSGKFWGKRSFLKTPGTVVVKFGPPINPIGKTAQQITTEAENWIEDQMIHLN